MKKLDKIKISLYQGVKDNKGKVVDLLGFLNDRGHEKEIKHLRTVMDEAERSRLKRQLPCATISGVFSPTRKRENLQQHSGLIVLDFDAKDNPNVTDWEYLKRQCSKVPQILYCSLSVSGNGIFMIIPLAHPSVHEKQFDALASDFKRAGLIVDPSGRDITRLRFCSLDDQPYINLNALAIPYRKVYVETEQKDKALYTPNYEPQHSVVYDTTDTYAKVKYLCEELKSRRIDITESYHDWVTVGFALAELGESGRELFHTVSSVYPEYNYRETERKFNECLRNRNGSISIATFFEKCSENGVRYYPDNHTKRKSAFEDFKDININNYK